MAEQIRYDLMVQDALRSVVHRVLSDAAKNGLMGEHHYYVSFATRAPGVKMSPRLREKYPKEMTIVLQHQFWDLSVAETTFDVGLSFDRIPEKLHVPFEAVTGFFDPSVQFGLKFEVAVDDDEETAPAESEAADPAPATVSPLRLEKGDRKAVAKASSDNAPAPVVALTPKGDKVEGEAAADVSAPVVSLDAFRKKK
jgi:uncharacterized protein